MSSTHLTSSERARRIDELQAYQEPDTSWGEPPTPAQCKLTGCTLLCWVEQSGRIHDYCSKTHARAAGALPPNGQNRTVVSASVPEHADLVPHEPELYPQSNNQLIRRARETVREIQRQALLVDQDNSRMAKLKRKHMQIKSQIVYEDAYDSSDSEVSVSPIQQERPTTSLDMSWQNPARNGRA